MARTKHSSPTIVLRIDNDRRDKAIASNSAVCLVADAINEQHPEYSRPSVNMATIRVTDAKRGLRYTYLTPASAQHCLLAYDQGWPNPIDEIVLKRAVKITPVISGKQDTLAREARRIELEQKVADGEPLTRHEKRALTQVRKPSRPSARGPVDVHIRPNGEHPAAVIAGGDPLPVGATHPNLLAGRDRFFGAKLADPGLAFNEAVEEAVQQRLAQG